jgi:hypothetical protein
MRRVKAARLMVVVAQTSLSCVHAARGSVGPCGVIAMQL